ncbi:ABC transporter permease [Streptomyces coelicoflavus]|uniref:ABC transporter permease n=1 Tax=Streptomyces TaxID=1883 RepID=UPI001290BE4C|nr:MULTISPECIES: ABC transporter permease [Streptomyces]MCX5039093.1 ABC transporter permease [Streptomyces coelicoflavus]QFX85118.1 FtsX-like permease family protein [Streptomyces sp. SYP-A7193]
MFVAWRDLKFAKGRFALMGTVIVLITLLVGLLSGLTAGLGQQNISAVTGLPADRIAFQAPGGGQDPSYSNSTVTERQWQRWAQAPGVTGAEPLGITTTKATAGDRSTGVSAFGVRPGSRLAPDSDRIDGRSAVLSTTAADDLGLKAGDSFTVAGQQLTVAAVEGDASFSHTPVVWTSLDVWQKTAPPTAGGDGKTATVIALNTTSAADVAATDRAAGTETLSKDDSLSAIGSYTSENGSLQLMRGFLFAISALVIGAFFTVWTIQRSGDVAVLKALGASTANLLKDALGQAVVLLAGGTLIGTGIAAALGALVAGSAVPFLLTPATVLLPAAVTIVLGALGAALSIRRITSVDPLTALGSAR